MLKRATKIIKPVVLLLLVALFMSACGGNGTTQNAETTQNGQEENTYTPATPRENAPSAVAEMPERVHPIAEEGIKVFHFVYRSGVIVISQPHFYAFTESNGIVTITVYSPNEEVRQLAVGDTFVFEPTTQHIEGLSGHVLSIVEQGLDIVITARLPESLDEVFYEFELVAEFDLLEFADESTIANELEGLDGIELIGNPTNYRGIRLGRNIAGINFEGEIRLYNPTLHVSLSLFQVNHLVLSTRSVLDIDVSAEGNIERLIPLFTIPIRRAGTGIDVPVGIRVTASGEFHLEIDAGVDAEFGIRNNNFVASVTPWYTLDFEFSARATASVNIQARARVLWGNVYGIEGDFGKGVQTNSLMQDRCPQNICFVVETFHVRRIGSLDGWGALGNVRVLQFDVDLARQLDSSFWYHSDWVRRRECLHQDTLTQTLPPIASGNNIDISEIFSMTVAQAIARYGLPLGNFSMTGGHFFRFGSFILAAGDAVGEIDASEIINHRIADDSVEMIIVTDNQSTINNLAWALGVDGLSELFGSVVNREMVDDMEHNEWFESGGYIVSIQHHNYWIIFELESENGIAIRAWISRM